MHVLAICAGIGGLELGLKLATGNAARTVAIIEREGYCASVLRARMQDGCLDDCPIWSDVKTFDARPWRGRVDCITAGYPCQPFSTAGRRAGHEDPRHLWPYIAGHIRVLRPRYVFCENVPGHLSLGFEQVCRELCEMGYGVKAGIFSAAEVEAKHLRKRLFFLAHLAYADGALRGRGHEQITEVRRGRFLQGGWHPGDFESATGREPVADTHGDGQRSGRSVKCGPPHAAPAQCGTDVADPHSVRQLQQGGPERAQRGRPGDGGKSVADPDGHGRRDVRPSKHESSDDSVTRGCETGRSRLPAGARSGNAETKRLAIASSKTGDKCACNGEGPAQSGLGEHHDGPSYLVDHLARGWPVDWEDGVPRVTLGQPHRIDRLRALGNAVVPQTAALAWTTLMQQAIDHATSPL